MIEGGAWRSRAERWVRDARTVWDGLAGRPPAPFTVRDGQGWQRAAVPAPVAVPGSRRMRVVRVQRETPDAVSLTLRDVAGRATPDRAGQFFTLVVRDRGEVLRRAYSASLPPDRAVEGVRVTVKRVAGGRVSGLLVDGARAGDEIDVLGPSGSFVVDAVPPELVLIAGGSGLTPLRAVAEDVLLRDTAVHVAMVVGNRREEDVLFVSEIAGLVAAFGARLRVLHVLAEPPEGWRGGVGLLDAPTTRAALERLGVAPSAEFRVCGPEAMMDAVRTALGEHGVAAERIREERFSGAVAASPSARSDVAVTVRGRGVEHAVVNRRDESLLESALAAGVTMPFSCTLGGCGACRVKLREGAVAMDEPNCLSPLERTDGWVLTCVGHAVAPTVVEVP